MRSLTALAGLFVMSACTLPPVDPIDALIRAGDLARILETQDCLPATGTLRVVSGGITLDVPVAELVARGLVEACA